MNKKLWIFNLCFLLCGYNAKAAWFSIPPETSALTENLTECQPFEYQGENVFAIKLSIKGRENEACNVVCDLTELENKKQHYHFSCQLSDFNIEEVKLAFEQATINVFKFEKNKDGNVILELFEGFTKNKICQQSE